MTYTSKILPSHRALLHGCPSVNVIESRFACFHQTSSFRTISRTLFRSGPAYNVSKLSRMQPHKRKLVQSRASTPSTHQKQARQANKPEQPAAVPKVPSVCLAGASAVLEAETAELKRIVDAKYPSYYSDDPLDLGEACWLAHWFPLEEWSQVVSEQSLKSLDLLWEEGYFHQSERFRLAFREFGTTLGVQCNSAAQPAWKDRTRSLNTFWETKMYSRDADITPMMYCASLNPGVFWHNYNYPAGNAHGN